MQCHFLARKTNDLLTFWFWTKQWRILPSFQKQFQFKTFLQKVSFLQSQMITCFPNLNLRERRNRFVGLHEKYWWRVKNHCPQTKDLFLFCFSKPKRHLDKELFSFKVKRNYVLCRYCWKSSNWKRNLSEHRAKDCAILFLHDRIIAVILRSISIQIKACANAKQCHSKYLEFVKDSCSEDTVSSKFRSPESIAFT